jgi:hypothetical protein
MMRWIALMLVLIAAASCSGSPPAPTAIPAPPTDAPLPFDAPQPTLAFPGNLPTTTYTDAVNGFAFDYPTGWTLTPPADASTPSYSIILTANALRIEIAVLPIETNNQNSSDGTDASILREEWRTFPDGKTALYMERKDAAGTTSYALHTRVGGRPISVTLTGDPAFLDPLVGSLRAI